MSISHCIQSKEFTAACPHHEKRFSSSQYLAGRMFSNIVDSH